MQEHMDPTKLSVAGLLGLALLKPKFLQTIRLDATYETEREKLLNQLPIDGNNSSEKYDSTKELSKMLDIAKLKEVAKSIEVMIFKQSNQLRLHIVKLVRNIEAHDPLRGDMPSEFGAQAIEMRLFHNKNDVGPLDLFGRNRRLRIVVKSP